MTNLPSDSTVLVFSPHADDETIACGALVQTLVAQRNRVEVYFLADSPRGVLGDMADDDKVRVRRSEATAACGLLGAQAKFLGLDKPSLENTTANVDLINGLITAASPAIVITTSRHETHPTHKTTTELVEKAMVQHTIPLWFGEVWCTLPHPTYMHYFDEAVMARKAAALACYASQMQRTDWIEGSRVLNRFRAITGSEVTGNFSAAREVTPPYAEAYEIRT